MHSGGSTLGSRVDLIILYRRDNPIHSLPTAYIHAITTTAATYWTACLPSKTNLHRCQPIFDTIQPAASLYFHRPTLV
jgi:hypothetical protein